MAQIDVETARCLDTYLRDCSLTKLAYFTNRIPVRSESEYLTPYLSYACFCASSRAEQSLFLFHKYWARLRKIPFNVLVSTLENGVTSRQFNFLSLGTADNQEAEHAVNCVIRNRLRINKHYPVLLKLTCQSGDVCQLVDGMGLRAECSFAPSHTIVRIDK